MTLSEAEILQILGLLEESSFGELRLEMGQLKVVLRKKGCIASGAETNSLPASPVPVENQVPLPQPGIEDARVQGDAGKPKKTAADREGTVAITSPMLGTVYLRPSPDAPPYVEVGSFVKEGDSLCLIEVMKVFTAVNATVRGCITEILVESNEMVEYGQPLFRVRPEIASARKNA